MKKVLDYALIGSLAGSFLTLVAHDDWRIAAILMVSCFVIVRAIQTIEEIESEVK